MPAHITSLPLLRFQMAVLRSHWCLILFSIFCLQMQKVKERWRNEMRLCVWETCQKKAHNTRHILLLLPMLILFCIYIPLTQIGGCFVKLCIMGGLWRPNVPGDFGPFWLTYSWLTIWLWLPGVHSRFSCKKNHFTTDIRSLGGPYAFHEWHRVGL